MSKPTDIIRKYKGSFTGYVTVVTAVAFLFILFKPGNNLINWAKVKIEIAHQEKVIDEYKRELESIENRINSLETDRDTLEKYAREEFHFASPDEDVYILPE